MFTRSQREPSLASFCSAALVLQLTLCASAKAAPTGTWEGETSQGKDILFVVVDNRITALKGTVSIFGRGCSSTVTSTLPSLSEQIKNQRVSFSGGSVSFSARFVPSTTEATGNYTASSSHGCIGSTTVSWTANLTSSQPTFFVNPFSASGGSVSPRSAQMAAPGQRVAFTVTADSGFSPDSTVGGTCPQGTWDDNIWTTGPINANCTVEFDFIPPPDDHGNSIATATPIAPQSSTAGVIEYGGDDDFFRIELTSPGSLTVQASGSADTDGSLLDADGIELVFDDDNGDGRNFKIVQALNPGVYYLHVRLWIPFSTGAYTLASAFVPASETFTAIPSAGDHGTISPEDPQTVLPGSTLTFKVRPNPGYSASVGGTCGGTRTGMTYTTNPMNADCTVSARFSEFCGACLPNRGGWRAASPR